MAAPVDGSSGGWAARALRRALALTSLTTLALLASLTGLLLSGPAGALPTLGPGWQRQNPDPPVSRTRSLLLDAASGQLRLEDGFHPDAVAWANLTNAIRETGWAYLDLSTNGRYNDSLQAYAAGVVEASVSEELIYMLTILEQIPGMVVVADKTAELYKTTYWASYNIPYFETVFNASGLQALVAQYGDWFSYTKNPRAKIFQRDQSLVEDMDAMVRLMRYNDFLHDPLSLCEACNPKPNAENAISARSDLNPANGSYPFQALHQRAHGGIDVKVTSFTLAKYMSMLAASGPTWDQCPPFQWSKSPFHSMLHMGQPDLWMFSPIRVPWD